MVHPRPGVNGVTEAAGNGWCSTGGAAAREPTIMGQAMSGYSNGGGGTTVTQTHTNSCYKVHQFKTGSERCNINHTMFIGMNKGVISRFNIIRFITNPKLIRVKLSFSSVGLTFCSCPLISVLLNFNSYTSNSHLMSFLSNNLWNKIFGILLLSIHNTCCSH